MTTDFDTLSEVASIIFGAGADDVLTAVSKSGAVALDPNKPPSKAAHNAAMAGNTVAAVGGAHALALSADT
jgi:hypothetical protein